jgi:predicted dehydrogenase
MNFVILGNGPEELAWATWLDGQVDHRLAAAFPGFYHSTLSGIPTASDLDGALAQPGIDAAIVGGPIHERGEYLRRAAAEGLAIICLHPPGDDSEAYYQVSLSRSETGAVIVPDLPLRIHPGVEAIRQVMERGELGAFRAIRYEFPSHGEGIDLARVVFPRCVDVVRAIVGEIEALTATGDPPGTRPDIELVVQLRAAKAQRAELRTWSGPDEPARLTLLGSQGSTTLEFDTLLVQPARLIRRVTHQADELMELAPWDAHHAIVSVLEASRAVRPGIDYPSPSLHDATRAMELTEATVRSLRRGRTVDLHYEPISEEATFKSVMTSTGCMILVGALFAVLVALSGPPLGFNWTIYIAYLIPPILVIFVMMQTLRFAVRRPDRSEEYAARGSTFDEARSGQG